MIALAVETHRFALKQVFKISRSSKTSADVIVVTLKSGSYVGLGEAVPYARYGESLDSVMSQINAIKAYLDSEGMLSNAIQKMPAGAAKNALDCAYWDLRAKIANKPVNELLGLSKPQSCVSAQTLSIDSPENMAQAAADMGHPPLIKVKLDRDNIVDKMRAIHEACPLSKFIVDANEAWTIEDLCEVAPTLAELNVSLIEQPLPADQDADLAAYNGPIAICADESCHTRKGLQQLKRYYDAINIKLDKTGGITEAVALMREAQLLGFTIMVGCMVGSSLAMAPAFLLSSEATFVDLDGPWLLSEDRANGFDFKDGIMSPAEPLLWGEV
ncbi:N-acetyl-D-Glu racemase DgcA [Pseudoalteromonas sp. MTN2-4]|uniref:N-acetyl-D-Glu racemase DgcA n=1 Tax=Pseudoalteromonas sp. MTN2-4 TaxID=3056555 RepID=UPI0036F19A95